MEIAGRWLAQNFNRPDFEIFDTYVLCGDGDMMEGVSSEAASFAGHLMLENLCWIRGKFACRNGGLEAFRVKRGE